MRIDGNIYIIIILLFIEAVHVSDCEDINGADLGTSSKESYWDTLLYYKWEYFINILHFLYYFYEPRMIEVGKGSAMQLIATWVSQS